MSELKRKASLEKQQRTEADAQAILQKMALHELRKLRRTTQSELASATGIAQSEISRIETRSNLTLGTLDTYIRGLGGELEIRAVFPEKTIDIDVVGNEQPSSERAA